MAKIATVTFTTMMSNLPTGFVPEEGFTAQMRSGDSTVLEEQQLPDANSHATFILENPGTYYAVVIKYATNGTQLGSAASTTFTLDQEQVELPMRVAVGVVDAVATPKETTVGLK